jgi:LmbE family N-acetylglucosaminyl deacetylase
MSHRPNDYHPDHRYTGVLVQDAAFMVAVPKFIPDVTPLAKNPVFLYYSDRFQKPNPFKADVVVSIDDVMEKKLAALERMESQFYEGGANGGPELMPSDAAGQAKRKADVRAGFQNRDRGVARQFRDNLAQLYGKDPSGKVEYAEAFEVCEYGKQPTAEELRKLFPFFEK